MKQPSIYGHIQEREVVSADLWEGASASFQGLVSSLGRTAAHEVVGRSSGLWKLVPVGKPDGSIRFTQGPRGDLKRLQGSLLTWLELHTAPEGAAHGFVKGRSNLTAADAVAPKPTTWQRSVVVVGTDIKSAFPTVSQERVRGVLRKMGLSGWALHLAVLISTYREAETGELVLATGSPQAPMLLNLILAGLDREATQKFGTGYVRYADDITLVLSGDRKTGIRARRWLQKALTRHGFCPHPMKHFVTVLGVDSPSAECVGVAIRKSGRLTMPARLARKRKGIARAVAFRARKGRPLFCGCHRQEEHDRAVHRLEGLDAYEAQIAQKSGERMGARLPKKKSRRGRNKALDALRAAIREEISV